MRIELITMWYNEEFLAPFFLNHYAWVDKIHILLTPSTDRTEEIIKQYPNTEIEYFSFPNNLLDDTLKVRKINEKYKSLTEADYVIVVDSDEFIFCNQLDKPVRDHIAKTNKDVYFVNLWQIYKHETDMPLDLKLPVYEQRQHGDPDIDDSFNILYVKPALVRAGQDLWWREGNHIVVYNGKNLLWASRNYELFTALKVSINQSDMLQGSHWRIAELEETIIKRVYKLKNRMSQHNLDSGFGSFYFTVTEEEIIDEYNQHKLDPIVLLSRRLL